MQTNKTILVTGATGYVGGRLIPRLLENGCRVRCLVRNPRLIFNRTWFPRVEVIQGDVTSIDSVRAAMENVSTAYYLIHSMASGQHYPERDIQAAHTFASAAASAGVEHIIYLGGLADPRAEIGNHMRSRIQTGDTLRQGAVPVTEFRASLVIGSGSISFEMIRFMTEQMPVLIGPRWLRNHTQPIAVQNVLDYLLAALENPAARGQIYEIGGKDVMTYAETMLAYARLRGFSRRILVLPTIPLQFMAFGVDLMTPVPKRIASPLIDGMQSDSIVRDRQAQDIFQHIHLLDYESAVGAALKMDTPSQIEPVWDHGEDSVRVIKHEGFFIESRQIHLNASPEAIYLAFTRLGGKHGWLYLNGLWQLRGMLDQMIGGPGMRGRSDHEQLKEGATIDFYRVEAVEPDHMIRLRTELNTPGVGWMEWRASPRPGKTTLFSQIAFFAPKGMLGFLYWYLLFFIHRLIFAGLFRKLIQRASKIEQTAGLSQACPKDFMSG